MFVVMMVVLGCDPLYRKYEEESIINQYLRESIISRVHVNMYGIWFYWMAVTVEKLTIYMTHTPSSSGEVGEKLEWDNKKRHRLLRASFSTTSSCSYKLALRQYREYASVD